MRKQVEEKTKKACVPDGYAPPLAQFEAEVCSFPFNVPSQIAYYLVRMSTSGGLTHGHCRAGLEAVAVRIKQRRTVVVDGH